MELTVDEIAAELSISKKQVNRKIRLPCTREQLDALLADPPEWLQRRQARLAELALRIDATCTTCGTSSRVDPAVAEHVQGFVCESHIARGEPLPLTMTAPRGHRLEMIMRTGSDRLIGWRFSEVQRPGLGPAGVGRGSNRRGGLVLAGTPVTAPTGWPR